MTQLNARLLQTWDIFTELKEINIKSQDNPYKSKSGLQPAIKAFIVKSGMMKLQHRLNV